MSEPKDSIWCTWEDWHYCLPPEARALSLMHWLARSDAQRWAPYFVPLPQRSTCPYYWRKADVLAWIRLEYGSSHPATIRALKAAGFQDAPAPRAFKNRNQRR